MFPKCLHLLVCEDDMPPGRVFFLFDDVISDVPIDSKRKGGKIVKVYELNRKTYDKVRKMDHRQMRLWAESLYKSGFNDGKETAPRLTSQEIRHVLLPIHGIGKKKIDAIVDALEAELQAKKSAMDMRLARKQRANLRHYCGIA